MSDVTIVAHDIGPIGGMERVLSKLVLGLASEGDRVTVIARSCELGQRPANVRVHRVPGPGRPFVLAYPWFALAAHVLLARHRRGIVHATGAIVPGCVDVISVHLLHHADAVRHGGPRASRRSIAFRVHARLAAWMSRRAERIAYRPRRARAFVAVSGGVADELRAAFPAIAGRIVTIPNGVDADSFCPDPSIRERRAALGLPDRGLVALFVGGEWARKGLCHAIEALARAPGWHLAVIGQGDQPAHELLAREQRVADRVHFVGVSERVAEFYRAADAFLLPTSYETFSLATYEAAASGLPLLAGDVGGIRDLVADGRTGFFVRPDGDEIAVRLRLLGSDPALRARLGSAARAAALRFSWEQTLARHRALYAELGPR